MILYHGSIYIIDNPKYNGSRPYNDYGLGFYCTKHADMAREWSVSGNRNGYINIYEFDDSSLQILNLNDYPIITWLAILLNNRTFETTAPLAKEAKEYILKEFSIEYSDYDVICGYRADDSYFSFAQDFISGVISYEQLRIAMKLGELGNQIVLKSRKAFEGLKFTGYEKVPCSIWYPAREERDQKAREKYHSIDKGDVKGALYITRILYEDMKSDDYRLR